VRFSRRHSSRFFNSSIGLDRAFTQEELKELGLFPTKLPESIEFDRSKEKTFLEYLGFENGKPWSAAASEGDYNITVHGPFPVGGNSGTVGEKIEGYAVLGSIECRPRGLSAVARFSECKREKMIEILGKFFRTSGKLHLTSTVGIIQPPVNTNPDVRSLFITSQQVIENGLGGNGDRSKVQSPANAQVACIFGKLTRFVEQTKGLQGSLDTRCKFTNLNFGNFGVETFEVESCVPAIPVNVEECSK
jgi:hypothetical protein